MTDRRQRHVLVVDGAAEVADLVREVLEEAGYRVSVAVEIPAHPGDVESVGVDLVVLDPGLGDDDPGWRLLRGMGQDHATAAVPVVVCAGDARSRSPRDLAGGIEERVIGVVPKPFDIDDLLRTVDDCLGSSPDVR